MKDKNHYLFNLKEQNKLIYLLKLFKLRLIILLFLFSLQSNYLHAQINSEKITRTEGLSEEQLLKGINSMSVEERISCAKEIRNRIKSGKTIVKPGNIFEHSGAYWNKKIHKYFRYSNYNMFEREFNLENYNRTPNYRNIKVYRLDHIFILSVRQNKRKTKVKVERLKYSPEVPDLYNIKLSDNFSGKWPVYDVKGTLRSETNYKNGKRHGLSTIYFDNGKPCWEKYYQEGKIQRIKNYSITGRLKSEKVYTKDEQEEFEKDEEYEKEFSKKMKKT